MRLLHGQDWSARIWQHLDDENLVRYQAAVREEDWRTLWDTLLKPFAAMRLVYRGTYKCRKAPDVFFGVNARFVQRTDRTSDGSTEPDHGNDRTSDESIEPSHRHDLISDESIEPSHGNDRSSDQSTERSPSGPSDGVPLPNATEWLDWWSEQDIPQQRTFVEFASDLGSLPLLPRSNSLPDLRDTANSSERFQL
jgi:hypothetical protein